MSKAKNATARQIIYTCCQTHPIPKVSREGRRHVREEAKKCVQRARDCKLITSMKIKTFLTELLGSMERNGINTIGGNYDGDTHGTYDERFVVTGVEPNAKEVVLYEFCTLIDRRDLKQIIDSLPDDE